MEEAWRHPSLFPCLLGFVVVFLLVLLRTAVVAGGAAAGGGWWLMLVVLGGAEAAGRWVEAGSGCCGRARSSRLGFVAWRRTASAAIYNVWRRLLPGGSRYGVSGIV